MKSQENLKKIYLNTYDKAQMIDKPISFFFLSISISLKPFLGNNFSSQMLSSLFQLLKSEENFTPQLFIIPSYPINFFPTKLVFSKRSFLSYTFIYSLQVTVTPSKPGPIFYNTTLFSFVTILRVT